MQQINQQQGQRSYGNNYRGRGERNDQQNNRRYDYDQDQKNDNRNNDKYNQQQDEMNGQQEYQQKSYNQDQKYKQNNYDSQGGAQFIKKQYNNQNNRGYNNNYNNNNQNRNNYNNNNYNNDDNNNHRHNNYDKNNNNRNFSQGQKEQGLPNFEQKIVQQENPPQKQKYKSNFLKFYKDVPPSENFLKLISQYDRYFTLQSLKPMNYDKKFIREDDIVYEMPIRQNPGKSGQQSQYNSHNHNGPSRKHSDHTQIVQESNQQQINKSQYNKPSIQRSSEATVNNYPQQKNYNYNNNQEQDPEWDDQDTNDFENNFFKNQENVLSKIVELRSDQNTINRAREEKLRKQQQNDDTLQQLIEVTEEQKLEEDAFSDQDETTNKQQDYKNISLEEVRLISKRQDVPQNHDQDKDDDFSDGKSLEGDEFDQESFNLEQKRKEEEERLRLEAEKLELFNTEKKQCIQENQQKLQKELDLKLLETINSLEKNIEFQMKKFFETSSQIQNRPLTDKIWFYYDIMGNIQGPFESAMMQQWYELGYFKDHLQIFTESQRNENLNPMNLLDLSFKEQKITLKKMLQEKIIKIVKNLKDELQLRALQEEKIFEQELQNKLLLKYEISPEKFFKPAQPKTLDEIEEEQIKNQNKIKGQMTLEELENMQQKPQQLPTNVVEQPQLLPAPQFQQPLQQPIHPQSFYAQQMMESPVLDNLQMVQPHYMNQYQMQPHMFLNQPQKHMQPNMNPQFNYPYANQSENSYQVSYPPNQFYQNKPNPGSQNFTPFLQYPQSQQVINQVPIRQGFPSQNYQQNINYAEFTGDIQSGANRRKGSYNSNSNNQAPKRKLSNQTNHKSKTPFIKDSYDLNIQKVGQPDEIPENKTFKNTLEDDEENFPSLSESSKKH